MRLNHAIKKIAAVGTGAMLLGMSAAAVSADLSDYPAPFIQGGEFSGSLVLGSEATTDDNIGMIEIATSLQAAATVPVYDDGSEGETVLADSVRIASGSTNLALEQPLSDVKTTLTEDDLDMLADVVWEDADNDEYDVEFRIALPDAAVEWTGDEDVAGDGEDPVFAVMFEAADTWNLEMYFPDGIDFDDFRGEAVDMLGGELRVSNDVAETSGADGILTLFRSGTSVSIEAGETERVEYNNDDFDVTVIDGNSDDGYAIIEVNGERERVEEGEYTTVNGLRIYVDDVFISNVVANNVIVNFFIGADKLVLQHDEPVLDADDEEIDGTLVLLNNLGAGDAWVDAPVTKITVQYTPIEHNDEQSATVNDEGDNGLELGEEYVDPVFGAVKFAFTDVVPAPTASAKELMVFEGTADDEMSFMFENYNGIEYDLVLFFGEAAPKFGYGNGAEEHYVFDENWDADDGDAAGLSHVQLFEDNRFIVADGEYTRVLEVTDIDAGDNEIVLRDLGTGESKTWTAPDTYDEAATGVGMDGTEDGSTYNAGSFVYDDEVGFVIVDAATPYIVLANDDGSAVAAEARPISRNGARIWFDYSLPAGIDWTDGTFTADETTVIGIQEETEYNNDDGTWADIVEVSVVHAAAVTGDDHHWTLGTLDTDGGQDTGEVALESNDDIETFKTYYGTYAQRNTDAEAPEVELWYPREQVYYNVFVGPAASQTQTGGSESSMVGERINPINVGAAIKDTEAAGLLGNSNLLVIGGPCVNSVASQLLGSPAECTAGFTPGEAMIKLFPNAGGTVSLLVAGYSGDDTRLAARVLASYTTHMGDLVGDEVVVSGISFDDVEISAPTQTMDDDMPEE